MPGLCPLSHIHQNAMLTQHVSLCSAHNSDCSLLFSSSCASFILQ